MTPEDETEQERLHAALADVLDLPDGHLLTGWIVVYESLGPDDESEAGHFYGPRTMTTWKAMGLVEWARQKTLPGALDGEDE